MKVASTAPATASKGEEAGFVLTARGLRKSFGGKRGRDHVSAVCSVDLDVRQGELVVLLGPSGCGKTTLLRMLAGLERPDGGAIALGGRTVFDAAKGVFVGPEHRRVGMMFQSYALWPHMTVRKNAAYALESRRGPERVARATELARVEEMLHRLGLEGLAGRFPGELSGGQQQRVALARALLGDPAVVFFDQAVPKCSCGRIGMRRVGSAYGVPGAGLAWPRPSRMLEAGLYRGASLGQLEAAGGSAARRSSLDDCRRIP